MRWSHPWAIVASGDRLHALYELALASGMRQAELLGLRWPDLALDEGLVHVRYQLKHDDGVWVWKQPKTRRSRRQIALPLPTVEVLREHCKAQARERQRIGVAWEQHDLVFCTRRGRPLSARNVYRAFKGLLEKGALPDVRFSAVIRQEGVQEGVLHPTPDMQQDAAAAMASALYGGVGAADGVSRTSLASD